MTLAWQFWIHHDKGYYCRTPLDQGEEDEEDIMDNLDEDDDYVLLQVLPVCWRLGIVSKALL